MYYEPIYRSAYDHHGCHVVALIVETYSLVSTLKLQCKAAAEKAGSRGMVVPVYDWRQSYHFWLLGY